METLALVFVLLIAGAATRATWRFGYTYLEEWEFFERDKRILDVKLPFWLMWIAGTLDATGILKAYILPFAPIASVALLGVIVLAGGAGLFMAPVLAYQKQHEYEIGAPDVWIDSDTRVGELAAYNDALRSAHEAVLAVSISVDEAEENLRQMNRDILRIATSDSGVSGTVPVVAHHRCRMAVMRC